MYEDFGKMSYFAFAFVVVNYMPENQHTPFKTSAELDIKSYGSLKYEVDARVNAALLKWLCDERSPQAKGLSERCPACCNL